MDDVKVEEVKASGKSLEDSLDDLILDEKAKPHPNPLNVMWVLIHAFGLGLREAKLLVGIRCSELDQGMPKSPERIRRLLHELQAQLG
jgi:hypothetical protein